MENTYSKAGLILSALYLILVGYLMYTQGIFGESFITIIVGLPWTLLLAFFEYFNAEGVSAYVLAFLPVAINAIILYWIGRFAGKMVGK